MLHANIILSACAVCIWSALAGAQPAVEPRPDVAGVTLDSKGQAVRKVNLILYPLETGPAGDPLPPYSAMSERDGRFAFYGIAPGRYRLEADHAGYLLTKFGAKSPWASGSTLVVRGGQTLAGIEIRMPEQATLAGTVACDDTVSYLGVALLRPGYQDGQRRLTSVATVQADADGEFSFNKLAPGRYYLAAFAGPGDPNAPDRYAGAYYPGTTDPGAAEAIDLKKGQSLSGLQLELRKSPVFRVSGTVEGVGLNPGNMFAVLRPLAASFNPVASGAMVADGAFEFKSILPGSYWLTVQAASPSLTIVPQAVEVSSSDVTGIVLQAEPPVKLSGSVKVEGGPAAIPGLVVRLAPSNPIPGALPSATVKADGSFTLSGVAGRYRIELQHAPPEAYVKSAALGDLDALAGLDLNRAAGDSKLAIVISYAAARVSGTVRDENGKPVDGVATLIPEPPRPDQPSLYQVVETENGHFQMQGIRPGKYRLYAWEEIEPGAYLDPQFLTPHQADSMAVEVTENERKEVELKRIPVE